MRATAALIALLVAAAGPAQASGAARIGIVIDDLGTDLVAGERVLRLPGTVACAILPHQPHSRTLANRAADTGHEVLLHLPMTADDPHEPGPGQIDADMPQLELATALAYDLDTVPHAVGINNHMGSRFTRLRASLDRLMRAIAERGRLFFLDSRTSAESLAADVAREHGLPVLVRDVFLDNDREPAAIERQFDQLLRIARARGQALAIAHPYRETLELLERRLPGLAATGVEIVPLSRLLTTHSLQTTVWPRSSSR